MQIESVLIDELIFDPANVRTHDNKNLDAIKGSLAKFGQQKPIVITAGGVVVAGNGTLAAAKALGWQSLNVVRTALEGSDATAYAIADNRTADLAAWDDGALAEILSALQIEDESLVDAAGFSSDELTALVDDMTQEPHEQEPHEQASVEDDEIPEAPPAITQPGEVVQLGRHTLIAGDCIELMKAQPENSIDAVVTDPPYGIGFMGKGWDCSVPGEDFAREAFRVLKPGGHLIAFAATRTVHRLTVALEDSGFEIRDQIGWLQWQGFPKSLDVSKAIDNAAGAVREVLSTSKQAVGFDPAAQGGGGWASGTISVTTPATPDAQRWAGWGTALKPSQEPAVLCRKPLEGTVAENVLKWGTGAINIDGCRIAYGDPAWPGPGAVLDYDENNSQEIAPQGRAQGARGVYRPAASDIGRWPANIYHCPKPSRGEREAGCGELPSKSGSEAVERKAGSAGVENPRAGAGRTASEVHNHHPTVKPVALMRWLVRLVTPPGGKVLEPFAGSGTTLIAAEREAVDCLGFEREPAYCDIIRARVKKAIDEG